MALAINNNLMANNVTRNLQGHYGKLGQSTQRLSSGLRVSSAADDAAGLAIRELMRADIAALAQGSRNANDGISMIQTADGALGVIDSKLIRMKELAEQASTDTYTTDQRKLINQEYQAMAKEINRIAQDTDFNEKILLDGTGIAVTAATGSATGLTNGSKTVTDYTTEITAAAAADTITVTNNDRFGFTTTDTYLSDAAGQKLEYTQVDAGTVKVSNDTFGGAKTSAITNSTTVRDLYLKGIADDNLTIEVGDGTTWTAASTAGATTAGAAGQSMRITYNDGEKKRVDVISNSDAAGVITFTKATGALSTASATTAGAYSASSTESTSVNIHFGSSSASTDSYDVNIGRSDADYLGIGQSAGDHVLTTDSAKVALENIKNAIETKDATRAELGATQNRLSATVENISIQKENLQAAESRISDVDVATEMTEFNKQQILANAAISMLSQANNLPKMAQKLLG